VTDDRQTDRDKKKWVAYTRAIMPYLTLPNLRGGQVITPAQR